MKLIYFAYRTRWLQECPYVKPVYQELWMCEDELGYQNYLWVSR